MSDKFFLDGTERKNLRNIITREIISNILTHREFASAYTAKFVIEKDRMYTENASRSAGDGIITQDNMEPNPKNPIIASFFRNIGWSDRLGSGVRNLFKYSKYYLGQEPEFIEGDIFRIIVPIGEAYSIKPRLESVKESVIKIGDKKSAITEERLQAILENMQNNIEYSTEELAEKLNTLMKN